VTRAPFVIAATAAGVAGILSFKTRPAQTASPLPAPVAAAPATGTATTPASGASKTPTTPPTTRSATGAAQPNQYGVVQVRVTVSGGRVTQAAAVQAPQDDPRSQEITATAVPQLGQEAVAAQSAQIDAVSGATYTSDGYRASLQSALDKLGPLTG
jgi:uncharacterized protein with FMN-binding domain